MDNDQMPMEVHIVDGPHKGEIVTLNRWAPSVRLTHQTNEDEYYGVVVEYKIDRRFDSNGDFAGYVGRSECL